MSARSHQLHMVWTGRGCIIPLIQETQLHTKAVTSLAILQTQDKLYSGSLDRTVRVWSINSEVIHCTQVHEVKDQVNNLLVDKSILCFIPQGAGIKMWSHHINIKSTLYTSLLGYVAFFFNV
ncbi:hypothetical protein CsSME_00022937 [Camellia sinensis var. sinensis]